MRTFRGLAFACLSAWGLAALPQPVFSQCQSFAGYANVAFVPGYNFAANPLDLDGTNLLTDVLNTPRAGCNCGMPDGTKVYVWDVTNQVFWPPATLSISNGGWDTNFYLPPGRGFVVKAAMAWTNTFVGNVCVCYTNHVFVAGSNKLSLIGPKFPAGVTISGPYPYSSGNSGPYNHQFQGSDGDSLSLFPPGQSYQDAVQYFGGYGWFDPTGASGTNGPVVLIGGSFFIQHPGADYDWTEYLPCQLAAMDTASSSPSPSIRSVRIRSDKLSLQVTQFGKHYDLQFSPDGITWTTISADRNDSIWTGPRPAGPQGFFRAVPSTSTSTKGVL